MDQPAASHLRTLAATIKARWICEAELDIHTLSAKVVRKNLKVVARAFSRNCNYELHCYGNCRLKLRVSYAKLVSCDSSGSGSSCLASSC